MKTVIQRVSHAAVSVDGEEVGRIGQGLLILLGIAPGDTAEDLDRMVQKTVKLRIFQDENGKMNRSVKDVDGEILVVSQFTLLANYKHGNRPDYIGAAAPAMAEAMYEAFIEALRSHVRKVAHGVFGAEMQVSLCNSGPVTIVMESEVLAPAPKTASAMRSEC